MYEATVEQPVRYSLMNEYRQQKSAFRDTQLNVINDDLEGYDFAIRSGSKFNLETDLTLTEEGIPIENRGYNEGYFILHDIALLWRG